MEISQAANKPDVILRLTPEEATALRVFLDNISEDDFITFLKREDKEFIEVADKLMDDIHGGLEDLDY